MDYHVEVDQSGKIKIPAPICKAFLLTKGDMLTIRQEEQTLRIITIQHAMAQARELTAPYLGDNTSVDDFLQWRKEEAWQENGNNPESPA